VHSTTPCSFLICILAAGCSESATSSSAADAAADASEAASPCSTGPAYDASANSTPFPYRPPSDAGALPTCTPRCGSKGPSAGFSNVDALPSGACSQEGELCGMSVSYYCEGAGLGRVDGMECACEGGTWKCWITSQGGGICATPQDGAAD
jgi:hypothetical protein